jgi:16S rRNA (cytosine1402-N4)-methyltransferase
LEKTALSEQQQRPLHQSVLLAEVIDLLRPQSGGRFVDCTLGLGGHSEAILSAALTSQVIGIDRDAESLESANRRLEPFGDRFIGVHGNFKDLASVLDRMGVASVQGIIADLGISSYQLDAPERGFSFQQEAALDMRMDRSQGETAADLVNSLPEAELADLIFEYGEERGSRKVARAIVRERATEPIETTSRLAAIVVRALNIKGHWRIHPATRTFQALRIAVNSEIEGLGQFVSTAISYLNTGARLAIISFHSLEDRIVKNTFRLESGICQCDQRRFPPGLDAPVVARQSAGSFETVAPESAAGSETLCARCGARKRVTILTRKPVRPTEEEMNSNPRSRSARLRVCERLA